VLKQVCLYLGFYLLSSFQEVDLGITADLGVLQLLPKIVGNDSLARELAYTGRKLYADEAKELGLVRFVIGSFLSLSTRR
jgi:enoyl-CoA hydratase/carnithine racemase